MALKAERASRGALEGPHVRLTVTLCAGVLGIILAQLRVPGITVPGMAFLGLLLWTVIAWATEVVPAGVAGVVLIVGAVVLKLVPPAVALAGFTNSILYLIIAGLVLGIAVDRSGLGRRVAYYILSRVGAERPWRVVVAFFLIGLVLTEMIPVVFGRLAVLIPLGLGLAEVLGVAKGSRYGKFLMAVVYFASQQFLLTTMTGEEPTLVAVGQLAREGHPILWGQYLVMWALPGVVLSSLVYLPLIWLLFRPNFQEIRHPTRDELTAQYRKLGPWSRRERVVAVIFGAVIVLWALDFVTHIAPTYVALGGMIALFLPGVDGLTMEEVRDLNLFNILFFASALSIGAVLGHLKLSVTLAQLFSKWLPISHWTYGSAMVLSALVQLVHLPLSTVTSAIATLTPILARWAQSVHVSPLVVTWVLLASTSNAWIFPYQVEPVLMVYNEGFWTIWDTIKMGLFMSVASLLLTPLFAVTWWPWTVHLLFGH